MQIEKWKMSDIWNDPPPVHYDDEERFGTAQEMIAEIRKLRTLLADHKEIRNAALEEAAGIADKGMLVPPDGGSPTEDEIRVATAIANAIRSLKQV